MNDSPDDNDIPGDRIATDRRPLGHWLRAVDALITREFALALDGDDIDRRDWMLLNAIAGEVEAPELLARLQRRPKRLRTLVERGWVELDDADGEPDLTDEGRAAMGRIGEKVDAIRSRVSGAVSTEDFATTLASLEAIARELGWDETMPLPDHRRHGGSGRRGGWGRHRFPSPMDPAFIAFARHTGFAGFPDGHGFEPHGHGHGHGHGRGHDFERADEFSGRGGHHGRPRHPGHGRFGRGDHAGYPGYPGSRRRGERLRARLPGGFRPGP